MKHSSTISSLALLTALFATGCSGGAETPVAPVIDSGVEVAAETASCATGELQCGGACVDPMKSHDHCGDCATTCGTAEACVDGKCSTACPGTQKVCSGACATVETDNQNCGECGKACASGQVCSKGACATSCASDLNLCGGGDAGAPRCANVKTDNDNCGACDVKCPAGKSCSEGACKTTCATGLTSCGDSCANLASDNANCGACGTTCGAGEACIDSKCSTTCGTGLNMCGGGDAGPSTCVNFQTDNANCGACGVTCTAGKVCSAGSCATTCATPLTTCGGGDAGAAYCANLVSDKDNCGVCGKTCATSEACVGSACIALCTGGKTACLASGTLECIDTSSDVKHCGSCDKVCAVGEGCNAGVCGTPDLTVTANTNLSTTNLSTRTCADGGDMVAYSVTGLTSTTATLSAAVSAGCLSAGDEVLLINLQGITGATGNVGNQELLIVDAVSGSTVTFKTAKAKLYGDSTDDSNVGVARTNQRVMLQRVPTYRNITVASGAVLTGNAWDGAKGGVFAVRASGTVTVAGTVSMKGAGYAGGAKVTAVNMGGMQGESYGGLGTTASTANLGGGSGGTGDSVATTPCATHGTAGGGGAHAAAGSNALHPTCGVPGGAAYGASGRWFLGSGGGSGGTDNVMTVHPASGLGGSGGGIIDILAPSIAITGSIDVSGSAGEGDLPGVECNSSATLYCWDYSGAGGGGAGGTIALNATVSAGHTNVNVGGGLGGNGLDSGSRDGGKGSSGRLYAGGTHTSCKALLAAAPTSTDGVYYLFDGTGSYPAYCDMTHDGGGWTLILDSNNVGPSSISLTLPVLPSTGRAMPLTDMQRLATAATQVHIRTTGDTTRSATSTADSTPMINLRAGVMLNNNSSTYDATVWTGPFATDTYLKFTCARTGTWPTVYQACGGTGLHIQGTYSRWLFASGDATKNEPMQVFVR